MNALTIGIPVYNEEKYLARTIESVLSQTFQDYAIIISDNSSTDASFDIAQHYASLNKRITVVRHPNNCGSLFNFKYCLDVSQTKYFVWLGAHDLFQEKYLEKAINFLENNHEFMMVYPKAKFIDAADNIIADSYTDIDTSDMSVMERLTMIAKYLVNCTSIHGVFRSEILKKAPFEKIIGSDHLILFATAAFGHIRMLDSYEILRREFRNETPEKTQERHINFGVFQKEKNENPYKKMAQKHIEFIYKDTELSFTHKLFLSWRVNLIYSRRFGF